MININFKKRHNLFLSDDNRKSYQYSLLFTIVSTILLLFCVLFILFLPKQFAQFILIPSVYYFFFFISFLFYSGIPCFELKQNSRMAEEVEKEGKEVYLNNNLKDKLEEIIISKELFKNPDLTLFDLSKEISIGSKQLSNFINHTLATNFSLYINNFRINEAKQLLSDNKYNNLTLEAIAELSGFRNRITFYRVFKKIENISPSEYKS